MQSIIIYNKNYPKDNKNIFKYNDKIYLLYDAKVINPPFFNKIIILHDNLDTNDLKMIYNMLNVNGSIYFIEKYTNFFNEYIKSNKFYVFQKKNNFQYILQYNRIVDFIIIGAQKSGTTALSLNISKHPDIFIDNNKDPRLSEIHFFDIYWKKGIEFYKKKFNYSKKIVGEKTPEILYLSYTFPLIQSINPYIKLIIILRNPIYRAFSGWKLVSKYFGETRSFDDAINDEIKNKLNENKTFYTAQTHYLQRGLYYQQIKELYKWFPKHNILILISEIVKQNMTAEYNKVYNFLNLKNVDINYNLEFESDNKSEIDSKLYNKLIKFYSKDVQNLEKLLKIKTNWFN
jgi:hypothetical protein